jgi:acetyl esterase
VTETTRSKVGAIDLQRLLSAEAKRSDEMEALFARLQEEQKGQPDLATLPIAQARAIRARQAKRTNAQLPEVESATRLSVPGLGDAPPVACELIVPKDARPGCVVYYHGGGWAYGDLDSHTRMARVLAEATQSRALYVDYRLAPENVYPAAHDDAVAAWRWVVRKSLEDPDFRGPLTVAGDSAGGNLAIAVALREMDAGRRAPDAALMFYSVLSDDVNSPSYLRFAKGYGLNRGGMAKFWEMYAPLPAGESERDDPYLCPVKASEAKLARLPSLFLNAAGLDPLLCDTLEFAARVEAAGGRFDLHVHEGVQHGFMQQTAHLSEARRAFDLLRDFYARALR